MMQICPKCTKTFEEGSKICRDCGAILDEIAAPGSETAVPPSGNHNEEMVEQSEAGLETTARVAFDAENDQELYDDEPFGDPWDCPGCEETVEANFDLCWNCGTDRDGTEDAEFQAVIDVSDDLSNLPQALSEQTTTSDSRLAPGIVDKCMKCDSTKVIPDAAISDQGEGSDGKLKAVVVGNPAAWVFRNVVRAELRANICGECGYVELQITNPGMLYEHYRESIEASGD